MIFVVMGALVILFLVEMFNYVMLRDLREDVLELEKEISELSSIVYSIQRRGGDYENVFRTYDVNDRDRRSR